MPEAFAAGSVIITTNHAGAILHTSTTYIDVVGRKSSSRMTSLPISYQGTVDRATL